MQKKTVMKAVLTAASLVVVFGAAAYVIKLQPKAGNEAVTTTAATGSSLETTADVEQNTVSGVKEANGAETAPGEMGTSAATTGQITPVSGQGKGEDTPVNGLAWLPLAGQTTNQSFRDEFEGILDIQNSNGIKTGMVYLDQANRQENNNTLYNAFMQYDFVKGYWNNEGVQSKLGEAVINVYPGLEADSLDARLAVINTYWSLLPEQMDEYEGSRPLTAGQTASILVRANNQVPAGKADYTYGYYFNQVKGDMYIKEHSVGNNLTKAEYLYTLVKKHLSKEFKGLRMADAGNRAEELSEALENLDEFNVPNDLKLVLDLCLDKGIISESEYDNWDELITLNDSIDLYIRVLEQTDMFGSLNKPIEEGQGGLEEGNAEVTEVTEVEEETGKVAEEETSTSGLEQETSEVESTSGLEQETTTIPVVEETTPSKQVETTPKVEESTTKTVETTVNKENTGISEELKEFIENFESTRENKKFKSEEAKKEYATFVKLTMDATGYPQHIIEDTYTLHVARDSRYSQVEGMIRGSVEGGENLTDGQVLFIMFTTDTYLKVPEQLENAYNRWVLSQDPNNPNNLDMSPEAVAEREWINSLSPEESAKHTAEMFKKYFPNGTGIKWNF